MIPSTVLVHFHPMIGCDFETVMPPGSPSPLPAPAPYGTMQILNGLMPFVKSKPTMRTICGFGLPLQQGTDIGFLIGHVGAPNVLLPVIILFSSSKSLFSASTVQFESNPVSTSSNIVYNLNLNCGSPMSTPTGMVLAPNTVLAGMTLGDFIAGYARVAMQMAISFIAGKISQRFFASPRVAMAMIRLSALNGRLYPAAMSQAARFLARAAFRERTAGQIGGLVSVGVDQSPLDDRVYGAGSYVGAKVDQATDAVVNLFTSDEPAFGGGQMGGGGAGQDFH